MEIVEKVLPVVALRGLTIMPGMVVHFDVNRKKSIAAIEEAMLKDQEMFVVSQRSIDTENPEKEDLYEIGTLVKIKQMIKLPKDRIRVLVSGEKRIKLDSIESMDPYICAKALILEDEPYEMEESEVEAYVRGLKDIYVEYAAKNGKVSKESVSEIIEIENLEDLVKAITSSTPLFYKDLQEILEQNDALSRYESLAENLVKETHIMDVKEEIQRKVKDKLDENQREFILREELKVIREELGDDNMLSDAEEFEKAAKELDAPEEVKEKLFKEIKRFKNSNNSPAETGVIRTYIETILEMPWNKTSPDNNDIEYAAKILDEDHYGLEDVKERVLEFLAVRTLTKKGESPILCLVGPPGTGKTSIARSLANALKKPYVRLSLGGVRDEAEIRGHRKTYVGAMPGRIANGLKTAGVKNPVMLLDEIDKVSSDYKGDTFSALLEVLDSEQNVKFRDHYLELPLDLSEVLFITTANTLQTIQIGRASCRERV